MDDSGKGGGKKGVGIIALLGGGGGGEGDDEKSSDLAIRAVFKALKSGNESEFVDAFRTAVMECGGEDDVCPDCEKSACECDD